MPLQTHYQQKNRDASSGGCDFQCSIEERFQEYVYVSGESWAAKGKIVIKYFLFNKIRNISWNLELL